MGAVGASGQASYTTVTGTVTDNSAAAIGATCTSGNINWTTAFADNSYTVVCTLSTAMTGQPHIVSTSYQAGGVGITITIAADTAAAANVAPTGFS